MVAQVIPGKQELIPDPLVIPFMVIVVEKLGDDPLEGRLADHDEA
jgi:hypothetical protein